MIDTDEVWKKGEPSNKPDKWRKDHYGAWIKYNQYGKDSDYGWVVDHTDNLRPLHYKTNARIGNASGPFKAVSSVGSNNINLKQLF